MTNNLTTSPEHRSDAVAPSTQPSMKLKIVETAESETVSRVDLTLSSDSQVIQNRTIRVAPDIDESDLEDIRWYLEDYPRYPFEPAPARAARVVARLEEAGRGLFRDIFTAGAEKDDLILKCLRQELAATRIEVVSKGSASLPWELLREPEQGIVLATEAAAFVRGARTTAKDATPVHSPIRILLVISRPDMTEDVPYQSVARELVRSVAGNPSFELVVVRPGSYAALQAALQSAVDEHRPYNILHFDGHGLLHEDRGYLVFEAPDDPANPTWIHGTKLGQDLSSAGVPIAILNACRSGATAIEAEDELSSNHPRALRSVAQEVADSGIASVVAMQYNVLVETASRFMGGLYAGLARGEQLGEATTRARALLAAAAKEAPSEMTGVPALQDWLVPVVYEAAPVRIRQTEPGAEQRAGDQTA